MQYLTIGNEMFPAAALKALRVHTESAVYFPNSGAPYRLYGVIWYT